MKKQFILIIMALALTVVMAVTVGTYAYFGDLKTSSANTFETGILKLDNFRDDLKITGPMFYEKSDSQNIGLNPTGLWKPNKRETRGMIIENTGSFDAKLKNISCWSDDNLQVDGMSENEIAFTKFTKDARVYIYAIPADDDYDPKVYGEALKEANTAIQSYINTGNHSISDIEYYAHTKYLEVTSRYGLGIMYPLSSGNTSLYSIIKNGLLDSRGICNLDVGKSMYFSYVIWLTETGQAQNEFQGKNYKLTFASEFVQR